MATHGDCFLCMFIEHPTLPQLAISVAAPEHCFLQKRLSCIKTLKHIAVAILSLSSLKLVAR